MTQKTKIIIDTDPGVDDALAIAFAVLHPNLELLGLTTVFGNVSVEQSTVNAGYLLDLLKAKHVPVAKGEGVPSVQKPHSFPDFVHGKNGFGDIAVNYPADFKPVDMSAADFIIKTIHEHPNEVVLVPIGPLTNIALALQKDPTIAHKVKEVVIMGGAAHEKGNVSPGAEANIWNDPHAAQVVFEAPWKVVMVGLDVTWKTIMPDEPMARIAEKSPVVGGFLKEICKFYANFYRTVGGFDGFSLHDPATVMYVTNPELFETEQGQIEVVQSGAGAGKTFFAPKGEVYAEDYWSKRDNAFVCLGVNKSGVLALLEDVLSTGH
ncbi:nucleoside hydrolase [Hydromonas duriensis]|uniref:Inosine-uridine nucleoside N-ribohydrolase n=1 Tax=Hydromonas duriensis TaxID=1527608 RepID=A0A4R6YBX9_9BURK|nr:nucleoside hydrolase [Hydromonas duriensis]TDR33111.1 inosine-uridine nucleoside N-ribohydrolase [Hydromonas duriensis]